MRKSFIFTLVLFLSLQISAQKVDVISVDYFTESQSSKSGEELVFVYEESIGIPINHLTWELNLEHLTWTQNFGDQVKVYTFNSYKKISPKNYPRVGRNYDILPLGGGIILNEMYIFEFPNNQGCVYLTKDEKILYLKEKSGDFWVLTKYILNRDRVIK